MLSLIAHNERRSVVRDRRFRLLTALVWGLLLTACFVGFSRYQSLKAQREAATRDVRQQWLGQGPRNPHSAAHYGTYAFRPQSDLSFVEFGVDSFVGTTVYLEGHRQNEARYSTAQSAGTLIRFGELTAALVLQLLLPLLIIFLCFNSFTKELESNTLGLLLSQGASMRQLALGKAWGYGQVIALIALPAVLLTGGLLGLGSDAQLTTDTLLRAACLLLFFGLYYAGFLLVSVWVSARSRSSATALTVLLGFWLVTFILIPKATANLGATLYEAPTRFAFTKALHDDEKQGIDGHNPEDERVKALETKVLAQYGVDSLSQLPISFEGLSLQEGEKYTSMVYNRHFGALQTVFQRQNRVTDFAGLVSPYLAVRNLSMGLAGSDYRQAVAFQQQAEAYRFRMVEYLNNYLRYHAKPGDRKYKVAADFWQQIPDFHYQSATVGSVLGHYAPAIAALLLWAVLGLGLLYRLPEPGQTNPAPTPAV
ncbi:DUF3526 domain-containing protein [Spirosoma arcticum]